MGVSGKTLTSRWATDPRRGRARSTRAAPRADAAPAPDKPRRASDNLRGAYAAFRKGYRVTDAGEVRSPRGRTLKTRTSRDGRSRFFGVYLGDVFPERAPAARPRTPDGSRPGYTRGAVALVSVKTLAALQRFGVAYLKRDVCAVVRNDDPLDFRPGNLVLRSREDVARRRTRGLRAAPAPAPEEARDVRPPRGQVGLLDARAVRAIRYQAAEGRLTYAQIGEWWGRSRSLIGKIARRELYDWVADPPRSADWRFDCATAARLRQGQDVAD